MQDPNHNKIQYRSEVMGQDGVVEGSLGLADQPVFGDWTISVKIQVLGPFSHYFYWAFSVKVQVLQSVITFTGPSLSVYRYSSQSLPLLGHFCQVFGDWTISVKFSHYFYWAISGRSLGTGPSLLSLRYSIQSLLLLGHLCRCSGILLKHYFYWALFKHYFQRAFSMKSQVLPY